MKDISMFELVTLFNHSEFRKTSIPMGLVSGWPCIRQIGRTLAVTIPYFSRTPGKEKTAIYPLYCSATVPVKNPDRIVDFTIYPYQERWRDVDYSKPAGYFKHEALKDVRTKEEYQALCRQLYGYYDKMVTAIMNKKPFEQEEEMIRLFSKLMEPGHFPQYLKINKKFYSYFCRDIEKQ